MTSSGAQREWISYNGSAQVESVPSVPWRPSATATNAAAIRHSTRSSTITTLSGGSARSASQLATFDSYGSSTPVDDLGIDPELRRPWPTPGVVAGSRRGSTVTRIA